MLGIREFTPAFFFCLRQRLHERGFICNRIVFDAVFLFFILFIFFIIFTGRTLTLLTILILYLHTYTLHCSYLQYLYKQAGQTLTLLTILALICFFLLTNRFLYLHDCPYIIYIRILALFTKQYFHHCTYQYDT